MRCLRRESERSPFLRAKRSAPTRRAARSSSPLLRWNSPPSETRRPPVALGGGDGARAVCAGEALGPDEAGGAVQQPALEVELAPVGDPAAAVGVGEYVNPPAAFDGRGVDPEDGCGAVLQDPHLGVDLAYRSLYRELVGVGSERLDVLNADHPLLRAAAGARNGG